MNQASIPTSALQFFEGLGTEENPILIKSADDLLAIAGADIGLAGCYFKQTTHIDLTYISSWPEFDFKGHYCGSGFSIRFNFAATLFASVRNSSIQNLSLKNASLAKEVINSHLSSCQVSGSYLAYTSQSSRYQSCEASGSLIKMSSAKDSLLQCLTTGAESFINNASETTIERCQANAPLGNDLHKCQIRDVELVFKSALNKDIQYLFSAGKVRATSLQRVLVSVLDAEPAPLYLFHQPVNITLENSLVYASTHANISATAMSGYNSNNGNLLLLNNISTDTASMKGSKFADIPKELLTQRQVQARISWDFESVWEWNKTDQKPQLRDVGMQSVSHEVNNENE